MEKVMKYDDERIKVFIVIISFLMLLFVLGTLGCERKINVYQSFFDDKRNEWIECLGSQDYEYMKHHREAIRNLIKSEKYDKVDSFPYEAHGKKEIMVYYTIGGYEFQYDGTLFGRKVFIKATATEVLEPEQ